MAQVIEVNSLHALASYQLVWQELWRQTRRASFFHSYQWFETYWRHFGAGQIMRVLVVSSGGKTVGILPLVVRRESTRVGRVRVLTYPLDSWGNFFGPIGPNPTATLLAGLQYLTHSAGGWDLLDLRWVDAHRTDHLRTPAAMRQVGFDVHSQIWERSAVIDLSQSWETYWKKRSPKLRENLERNRRRLAAAGNVEHLRYRPAGAAAGDDDPRWDLFDACVSIASRSWQARQTEGNTLSHSSVRPFLEEAHRAAAVLGCLDLNLLVVKGQPIAFAYNYICEGRIFGLRTGYDPAWQHFSPGNVLKYLMIRDSFLRGDAEFDLGPGYLESKRPWATDFIDSLRYTHFSRRSPRAQVLRWKRWFDDRFFSAETILARRSA